MVASEIVLSAGTSLLLSPFLAIDNFFGSASTNSLRSWSDFDLDRSNFLIATFSPSLASSDSHIPTNADIVLTLLLWEKNFTFSSFDGSL
ncbi:hypothetical protein EUGRSUZ_G00505 [Eucalyptus grandis]|uniref:Uncharacterized protein n=2 Tax=Eucalyptus grandis TaxID=71139 RepID=A0ACC3K5S4_EUCGR|nr:hypothetical protein EUGRSUZ_G00505 [Eucalyptus grandis]